MNFPITASISPVPYGPKSIASVLKVDGNAGSIPPFFQYAVLTEDGALCDQGTTQMTADQWSGWADQDDAQYVLDSVAANLSLSIA